MSIYGFKSVKNGMWMCADNYGNGPLVCNRNQPQDWEKFYIHWEAQNKGQIQSITSKKFICLDSQSPYVALSGQFGTSMVIRYVGANNMITICAETGQGLYLSVKEQNQISLAQNQQLWEQFYLVQLN